ncbi:MAG: CDP-diacylglycerol--glycerol-3-phosphate 3-phosphatidyltransferase [candidate division Zixibacteria bacterium]|nr:CDP-diacylglycerol--glycerol-3-phosphate 3-phosphatidyltransferase [candidate division Zixibacteria bacterium]
MNLPNFLTMVRIVLAPVFMALFIVDNAWAKFWAMIIFIVAALTDLFDGYYARKYGISTSFGKFFDPLADKILTSLAFIAFVALGYVQMWMVLLIILREFLITGLRTIAAYRGVLITPSWSAKAKTFLQMTSITVILLVINARTFLPLLEIEWPWLKSPAPERMIFWLMFATVAITVGTGIDYLWKSLYLLRNTMK